MPGQPRLSMVRLHNILTLQQRRTENREGVDFDEDTNSNILEKIDVVVQGGQVTNGSPSTSYLISLGVSEYS